jgi:hypothetical protein
MTHKKLILMALMGVMLSDAEARLERKQKRSALSARGRGRVARGRPQMNSDNTGEPTVKMDNEGGGFVGDQDDGGNRPAKGDPDPAPKNNEQLSKVDEPLDLDVMENLTRETKTLLHTNKDSMTRGEALEKVTGKSRQSGTMKGQGNLLNAWAAIGDDRQPMREYLMQNDMMKVLNAFGNTSRVGGTAAFAQGADDRANTHVVASWTVVPAGQNPEAPAVGINLLNGAEFAINGSRDALETSLRARFESFFDAFENVKFATADGFVDFPEFSRAEMTIKDDLMNAVQSVGNLHPHVNHEAAYANLMKPVAKAWKETATNAIKAVQKLAVDEKEKGNTLFLPQLTNQDGGELSNVLVTGGVASWLAGSTTAGINGTAGGNQFKLKLGSVKPGEKRAFLKMDRMVPAADNNNIAGTTMTAAEVVTENGVKLLNKLSDFYKKAKGTRAAFNPDAWQQKIAGFTVSEQKIIDAYNAELEKKASGTAFTKAKTKLESMLARKTSNASASAALGNKFARHANEDNDGL